MNSRVGDCWSRCDASPKSRETKGMSRLEQILLPVVRKEPMS